MIWEVLGILVATFVVIPVVFRSVSCVPVVTDVSVSPASVGVLGDVSLCVSDCETVKSQSFSSSRRRRAFHMESQGEMNTARSPEDVQPLSRRRTQEVDCGANQQSLARRMLSYLDHSEALKVDARDLEDYVFVFAPNEPRVDIEHTSER